MTTMTAAAAKPNKDPSGRRASRDRLLLAALPHIAFDGWTERAFRAGIAESGMPETDFRRFFPGGMRDAVEHFSDWADRRMAAALAEHDIDKLPVREKVALAVRLRFEALAPWRESVRRALAMLALPPYAGLGARTLYRTVDTIWHAIGDRSADFNFYTKRALLAAVIASTTLFWLDDTSENSEASWAFLDRRIADVMKVPALGTRLRRLVPRLPTPIGVYRAVRARGR